MGPVLRTGVLPAEDVPRLSDVPRRFRWLLDGWTRSSEVPAWDETSWERGKSDAGAWAKDRPISFGLLPIVVAAVFGVLVARVPDNVSLWLRLLLGVAAAAGGFFVGVLLLAVWLTLRAPYKQRDEARAELTRRREVHDLIGLDKQLRAIRDANSRILEEVKEQGRTGPLGDDQDPWVRGQNENLGLWLETAGFPELVPVLVLDEPPLTIPNRSLDSCWSFPSRTRDGGHPSRFR
jgi:hypothetical protein